MILLDVVTHLHPIWGNVFFYLFVSVLLLFSGVLMPILKTMKKKSADLKLIQQQHVARVDVIRKEHSEKLESLRVDMLKREEERSRQWIESEKETLHVLNGVSNLLELSDKVDKAEFKKINTVLANIEEKITTEKKLMSKLQMTEKKYRELFENSFVAISVHDIVFDENGKPCDYRFIEVNKAFEEFTGLKAIDVVGRTCLEVIPDVEKYWIDIFGKVATTGVPITFENYNRSTQKNYRVSAYAPEPNKFVALSVPIE